MELDVRLSRAGGEQWGFRLIGGVDFSMPLTVVKVIPNSPADVAGLQNGDTVYRINEVDCSSVTHEDSKKILAHAAEDLTLGVVRGLYDMVLDDFDPMYESTEPPDSDQPSQPTEVDFNNPYGLPTFTDNPDLLNNNLDLLGNNLDLLGNNLDLLSDKNDLVDAQKRLDSRSLTASPYVTPTKPYRPFSTEPLVEVPPLEDPIILNPDYQDVFGRIISEEFLPATRFKLPISEQYDPDGTKQKMKLIKDQKDVKITEEFKEESSMKKVEISEMKEEKMTKSEVKFLEQMKKDIDLEKIESTACSIVDESIVKALTVAEQIKKEIDVELSETSISEASELKSVEDSTGVAESEIKSVVKSEESQASVKIERSQIESKEITAKESAEPVALTDNTAEQVVKQENRQSEIISDINETDDKKVQSVKERKISEISNKDFVEKTETSTKKEERKEFVEESKKRDDLRKISVQESKTKVDKIDIQENVTKTQAQTVTGESKTDTRYSTSKLLAEQRAYVLGLQTIPNIRGTVHSSYHYDLLLKTFFIHLTDVMVALSRFILAEPVLSQPIQQEMVKATETERQDIRRDVVTKSEHENVAVDQQQNLKKEDEIIKSSAKINKEEKIDRELEEIEEQKVQHMEKVKQNLERQDVVKQRYQTEVSDVDNARIVHLEEKRVLSGSRMAQLTEKKSEELMQNLEAVITEFESKSSGEDIAAVREKRSRSRSRAEQAPFEICEFDTRNQGVTELTTTTTSAMSSSYSESVTKKSETRHVTEDYTTGTSKEGKNTYIGIVQAHVYTNKDAIFDEQRDVSETTSVGEKVVAAISSQNVTVSSTATKVEKSREISSVSRDAVQVIETTPKKTVPEVKPVELKPPAVEEIKVEKAQKVVIQEVEPVIEETKSIVEDYKVTEIKDDTTVAECKKDVTVNKEEAFDRKEKSVVAVATESISTAKEEVVSVKQDLKEQIATREEISTTNEEKNEILTVKEQSVSVAKPTAIEQHVVEEVQPKEAVNAIKNESNAIKEETRALKFTVAETTAVAQQVAEEKVEITKDEVKDVESVKQESIAIKDEPQALDVSVDETTKVAVKEKVAITKDEVKSVEAVKEEARALKVTAAETKTVQQNVAEEKVAITKDEVESVESSTFKQETVSLKEVKAIKEDISDVKEESIAVKQQEQTKKSICLIKPRPIIKCTAKVDTNASSALKIVKEQVIEQAKTTVETDEELSVSMRKLEINEFKNESSIEESFKSQHIEQESTFVAKSVDTRDTQKLSLDLNQKKETQVSVHSEQKNVPLETLTTPIIPPTPLTDEYVFKLSIPLPKREGTPIPRDCTPSDDDEDPDIVKRGLVPHIESEIQDRVLYSPPLPTPTSPRSPRSPQTPVFTSPGLNGGQPTLGIPKPAYGKPGLRGGVQNASDIPATPKKWIKPRYIKPGLFGGAEELTQEEILEIERKSTLLASAIDETIKSIEEYKEEVGMENGKRKNSDNGVIYNGYAKVVETKIYDSTVNNNNSEVIENNSVEIVEVTNGSQSKIERNECKSIQSNGHDKGNIELTENVQVNGTKDEAVDTPDPQPIITEIDDIEMKIDILSSETVIEEDKTVKEEETAVEVTMVEVEEKPFKKEVFQELEKAVEVTIAQEKKPVEVMITEEEKRDPMAGYKPVHFDPEELLNAQRERRMLGVQVPQMTASQERELYKTETGELMGTRQGIVDGLEEAVVDTDAAKEMGKPGITEEKIAELMSGEAEMLREAHVMGLKRVLAAHIQRDDDSSVDFKKIKPTIESLKDSEVLKALNEEMLKAYEKKKQEEKKWTTFLQKPKRPVPKAKFGYPGNLYTEDEKVEPYKVKIVKQPKPKVAPDYKPKEFNTGLLPWEERALREPTPPPVEPEDPILIPEEAPEILEAVDPLPESEIPDLEDSGIPLPPPPEKDPSPSPEEEEEQPGELDLDAVIEETEKIVEDNIIEDKIAEEMERGNIAEQIMMSVQNMVDPNAPLDAQLAQMRAQLAALAQLPGVIQQSLELVTRQLSQLSQLEPSQPQIQDAPEPQNVVALQETEAPQNGTCTIEEIESTQNSQTEDESPEAKPSEDPTPEPKATSLEEIEHMKREEEAMLEEQKKMEKQKKELMEQARLEHESRQVKQRPTPRVGKPKPVFGPVTPQERPLVLPGGRKWRKPQDAYNEQIFAETLAAQAEIIAGKAKGINFMKYEKPPVSLDHLKDSDVYKMIHNMEQAPGKRVEMLTPVIAEVDYREKCRSMTPCPQRLAEQVQP